MKLIDQYLEKQKAVRAHIEAGELPPDQLFYFQELNYRICVLETMRDFCNSAPQTTELRILSTHYRVVDAYVRFILAERQFGCKTDEDGEKRRETAHTALEKVVFDCARKFSGYQVSSANQYKEQITTAINTIMPVWLEYRTTYIKL